MPDVWGPGAVVRLGCCAGTARSAEAQLGGWKSGVRALSLNHNYNDLRSAICAKLTGLRSLAALCDLGLKVPKELHRDGFCNR